MRLSCLIAYTCAIDLKCNRLFTFFFYYKHQTKRYFRVLTNRYGTSANSSNFHISKVSKMCSVNSAVFFDFFSNFSLSLSHKHTYASSGRNIDVIECVYAMCIDIARRAHPNSRSTAKDVILFFVVQSVVINGRDCDTIFLFLLSFSFLSISSFVFSFNVNEIFLCKFQQQYNYLSPLRFVFYI